MSSVPPCFTPRSQQELHRVAVLAVRFLADPALLRDVIEEATCKLPDGPRWVAAKLMLNDATDALEAAEG